MDATPLGRLRLGAAETVYSQIRNPPPPPRRPKAEPAPTSSRRFLRGFSPYIGHLQIPPNTQSQHKQTIRAGKSAIRGEVLPTPRDPAAARQKELQKGRIWKEQHEKPTPPQARTTRTRAPRLSSQREDKKPRRGRLRPETRWRTLLDRGAPTAIGK